MRATRCGIGLVAALLLVLCASAEAQAPVQATIPSAEGEVTIVADRLEQLGPDNLLVATGNVELTRGQTRLVADRLELNRATGDAVAQGRVIFWDGEDRMVAERMDYNLNSGTGVIYRSRGFSPPYYRLSGDRVDRLGDSLYRLRGSVFTTCEDDPPTWSFHASSADADLESFVSGWNASFWVKNIPVVPWIPYFAAVLRRERQTGFLFPRFGETSRKGYFAEIPFYWAISDSQDATITLNVYGSKGIGGNLEYRYILSQRHAGTVSGFYVKETEVDGDDRGWGGLKDEWILGPGLSLKADVNMASDDDVFREYTDLLRHRALQRVDSNVFVTKVWPTWTLVGNLYWYQDLTTERPVELHRLPDIRLDAVRQPMPGVPGLLYELNSSATRFVREVGSDGGRVDLRPRLLYPFSPGGFFTLTPFVGGRLTGYDRTVTGSRTGRDGFTVEKTNDDLSLREVIELGADLEARASRIYALGGLGGIDAVLHSIEPRVNYTWLSREGEQRLPQWDAIDAIVDTNLITYSLINRIRARTVAPPGTEPARWELARLTLTNSHDFRKEERPFGDVFGDLVVQPGRYVSLRSTASYDIYGLGIRTTTTDIGVTLPFMIATVGTRVARDRITDSRGRWTNRTVVNFLQGEVEAELTRHLAVRAATNWDLKTDTFVENRVGVDIRFQCWVLSLDWVTRDKNEDEIRFAVSLLGVGAPIGGGGRIGSAGGGGSTAR